MTPSQVPQSRVYTHERCSSETVVGDEAFKVVSNPLSDMTRTWCSTCNSFFPLSEYAWADSGEKIVDYYQRHGARASGLERFLCSRTFLIISAVAGLLAGIAGAVVLFLGDGWGTLLITSAGLGVMGVVLLASLTTFALGPAIVRRVCGVSDTRTLK